MENFLVQTNENLENKISLDSKTEAFGFKKETGMSCAVQSEKKGSKLEIKDIHKNLFNDFQRASDKGIHHKIENLEKTNKAEPIPKDKNFQTQISKFSKLHKNSDNLNSGPKSKDSKTEQNIHTYLKEVQRRTSEQEPATSIQSKLPVKLNIGFRNMINLPFQFTAQQLSDELIKKIKERNMIRIGASDNLSLIIVFMHRGLRRS
jgi:hypothetical protein